MSDVDVGTYFDLRHLNRKEVAPAAPKKSSFQEAVQTLVEVGTHFDLLPQGQAFKVARRIPVVYIS